MFFGLDRYSKVRPRLHQLTARQNVNKFRTVGGIMSTFGPGYTLPASIPATKPGVGTPVN